MINKLLPDVILYDCSIEGCGCVTVNPFSPDPRQRWIIGLRLKEEDDSEVTINLCPGHVRRLMPGANEDFFDRVERTEEFVRIQ
jgi:hypothetical protein